MQIEPSVTDRLISFLNLCPHPTYSQAWWQLKGIFRRLEFAEHAVLFVPPVRREWST